MDPLSPINCVFSLISQEERQRSITLSLGASTIASQNIAFLVNSQASKKSGHVAETGSGHRFQKHDRPFCTH